MSIQSIDRAKQEALDSAIAARPRFSLGSFPTPLEEAPRLSERLGVRILVKRDDQTGLGLGGNKVRKLEFLIAEAVEQKADCVITTGGSQSNHARLAAAACRKARLDCFLVLDRGLHPEFQGNLLLDRLFGAQVHLLESQDPADAMTEMVELGRRLEAQGRTPCIIPRGGANPVGATGYVAFVPELLGQLQERQIPATSIYLGTGSMGTHAGVLAGLTAVGASIRVQGISVSRTREEQLATILTLSNATLEHLGRPQRVEPGEVLVDDRFVGAGYGHPTAGTMEAIDIAARDEALVLDPVYTGKAMSGLIDHALEGRFEPDDVVVFLHTGGAPALFAYHAELARELSVAE